MGERDAFQAAADRTGRRGEVGFARAIGAGRGIGGGDWRRSSWERIPIRDHGRQAVGQKTSSRRGGYRGKDSILRKKPRQTRVL